MAKTDMKTRAGRRFDKGFPGKANTMARLLVIVGAAFVGIGSLPVFIAAMYLGMPTVLALLMGLDVAAAGFFIGGLGVAVQEARAMRRDLLLTSYQLREHLSGQVAQDSPADSRGRAPHGPEEHRTINAR